jgi:4-alpha-glucanotransferase
MNREGFSLPPFPPQYRASGLLLHVTSLPSPYGIGDLGPAATAWIDVLVEAGQSWWQSLPLSPTGYGNSPYQPLSSFAGNTLLISPDWLVEDGFVRAMDCEGCFPSQGEIDYEAAIKFKQQLLERAWMNFQGRKHPELREQYAKFRSENADWLEDYALFRALKTKLNDAYYLEWPKELVQREAGALKRASVELAKEIDEIRFAQFLLFCQSERLKAYAQQKGLRLIGDLPFFVSPDSSDVWANPGLFLLDQDRRPQFVAGVPPDYFSADGQLWGNPLYNWDALRRTGFRWYIARLRSLLAHVDVIRLDHFRGFAAAWHVPVGAASAKSGEWVPGPGAAFLKAVEEALGSLPFIAEDLGMITPDVYTLRDAFQLPGMRVLQFAFDGRSDNPYLPHNFVANTVVYTGTHDNPPLRSWYEDLPDDQRERLAECVERPVCTIDEVAPALMALGWSSVAALAIAPLQDVLNLGREARMNVPGRADGNWRWRATQDMLLEPAFERLRDLTQSSGRLSAASAGAGHLIEAISPD